MALVLNEFRDPVVDPDGRGFRARVCALPTSKGAWQGWIEFNPVNGDPTFRSPNETMQPSRVEMIHWAESLTRDYIACALGRARDRIGLSLTTSS